MTVVPPAFRTSQPIENFPDNHMEQRHMTTPDEKPIPPTIDQTEQTKTSGPTAPAGETDDTDKGPKTGGYDDHSPDRTSSNEKGGYGTG